MRGGTGKKRIERLGDEERRDLDMDGHIEWCGRRCKWDDRCPWNISNAPSLSRSARLMCVVHCLSFAEKHRGHLSKFEKRKLYDMDS